MHDAEAEKLVAKGIEAINKGDTVSALGYFERVVSIEETPINRSFYAYCIARERGQFKKAISMCDEAMKEEPQNPVHYLNLGRIYLISGQRSEALRIFREGLNHGENKYISDELADLGLRKPPVITFLKRDNPFNKYLGIILSRVGLR